MKPIKEEVPKDLNGRAYVRLVNEAEAIRKFNETVNTR